LAATSTVTTASPSPATSDLTFAAGSSSSADRLKRVQELHDAGLITDAELDAKRRAILDEL